MKYNYLQISPSEMNAGFRCRRNFVLQRTHQRVDLPDSFPDIQSFQDILPTDTLYEVAFPQGFRVDAWIASEHLAIEFKSGMPSAGDIFQCWHMMEAMMEAGIDDFSMQLWYYSKFAQQAVELANDVNFELRQFPDFVAIKVDYDRVEDLAILRNQQDQLLQLSLNQIPEAQDEAKCHSCLYHDYCHI